MGMTTIAIPEKNCPENYNFFSALFASFLCILLNDNK
jgi:hypothetical protein